MKRKIKRILVIKGIVLFFFFSFLCYRIFSIPEVISKSIGIFFLSAFLWITNVIPHAITGILIIALTPLLGVLPSDRVFSFFGNRAIFFILGIFILSSAIMKSGLARRFSIVFFKVFSKNYTLLIQGVFIFSYFLSFFIPEHAVAALLFPVLFHIALKIDNEKIKKLLFLSMAWGAISGGIATPLGGARVPLAMGIYTSTFGEKLSFLKWSFYSFPISFLFFLFGIVYIFLLTKNEKGKVDIDAEINSTFSSEEKRVLLIYGITLFLWVFMSEKIDMAVSSLLGAFLLFAFRVISWKDVEGYVNWGIILMYGGAIVLGTSLYYTGTAEYISHNFLKFFVTHKLFLFFALLFTTLFLTETMSNVATCALMLPIAYGFTDVFNPVFITVFIATASGLAFLFPIGSPPNAIAFSSGRYSLAYAFLYSLPFFLLSPLFIFIVSHTLWLIIGF